MYGVLSIIFGFSDPENPHFDILYVNVLKYLKKYKIWQFFEHFRDFHRMLKTNFSELFLLVLGTL